MLHDVNLHIERFHDANEASPTARLGRLFCFSVVLISRDTYESSHTETWGEVEEREDWELAALIVNYHARDELRQFLFLSGAFPTAVPPYFPQAAFEEFGTEFKADITKMSDVPSISQATPMMNSQKSACNQTHSTFTFRKYLHEMTTNGSIIS